MSAHPTAVAAVSELGSMFPDKLIEVLTSQVEVARLPGIVKRLRNLRGGGIVVLFTKVPEVVVLHQLRLSRMRDDGVTEERTIPVEEGSLVVGMVKSRVPPKKPRPSRQARTEPRPAAEPVLPEMEVIEGADLQELDLRRFGRQLAGKKGRRKKGRSVAPVPRNELVRSGLARLVEGLVVPTLAGMLAYGHRPELWVEGARAVVAVDGQEREFAGSIQKIVREALRWEPLVHCIGAELIAPALVNAFAHRDWSASAHGQPVEVVRQGERIEIRNPGALASGWSTRPAPRNPTIHRLLRRRRLAGKPACGLGAVTRGLERLGALPFSLVGRDGLVRFVIEMPWRLGEQVARDDHHHESEEARSGLREEATHPAMGCKQHGMTVLPATVAICPMASRMLPAAGESDTKDEARPPNPAPVLPAPSAVEPATGSRKNPAERKAEIRQLLHQRGEMTTREVVEALDWTRSTTRAVIAAMVEEGVIEGCADAARSPSQRYRLVDGD